MYIIAVLWTAFFVINFNIAMMIPLLPFIQREIGLSPAEAGTVLAAFPVVALISNLALGPLIDRYGRKRFIVTGAAACAALLLLTAASRGAVPIALGRAATGLFMPMIGASVFAAIADYIPSADRSRVAGYVTSAAPIAFLCSISLGVLLGGLVSWQLPLIIFAAICLALAVSASALPPTSPQALSSAPISGRTYRERLLPDRRDGGRAGERLALRAARRLHGQCRRLVHRVRGLRAHAVGHHEDRGPTPDLDHRGLAPRRPYPSYFNAFGRFCGQSACRDDDPGGLATIRAPAEVGHERVVRRV
jgi:MFS family permease